MASVDYIVPYVTTLIPNRVCGMQDGPREGHAGDQHQLIGKTIPHPKRPHPRVGVKSRVEKG